MVNDKGKQNIKKLCNHCKKELKEPRYKYDNGYCKECYFTHYKRKNNNLIQEGDECLRCKGKIRNKPIWENNQRKNMVGRIIQCDECEYIYRRAGETKDNNPE